MLDLRKKIKTNGAYASVWDAVGQTPLIRLRHASKQTGCEILGKAEWMNPSGSVKDRAAKWIIADAEAKGILTPGATIIEGTAGNTGIGLTMLAKARGYKAKIVIPETQTLEKKDVLRQLGAELIEVPAVPYKDPNNYARYPKTLVDAMNAEVSGRAIWANQFDNLANKQAHIDSTGPEIWQQTEGKIDGFICAVGSGGTISGVADFLRTQNKDIAIALADPYGAALYSYYTQGILESVGSSMTEGIGQGRITENLKGLKVDHAFRIDDETALNILFDLTEQEGLSLGTSSGINIAGAIALAKELGPGHRIVTMLCDSAARYASKLFNRDFLLAKALPLPHFMRGV